MSQPPSTPPFTSTDLPYRGAPYQPLPLRTIALRLPAYRATAGVVGQTILPVDLVEISGCHTLEDAFLMDDGPCALKHIETILLDKFKNIQPKDIDAQLAAADALGLKLARYVNQYHPNIVEHLVEWYLPIPSDYLEEDDLAQYVHVIFRAAVVESLVQELGQYHQYGLLDDIFRYCSMTQESNRPVDDLQRQLIVNAFYDEDWPTLKWFIHTYPHAAAARGVLERHIAATKVLEEPHSSLYIGAEQVARWLTQTP